MSGAVEDYLLLALRLGRHVEGYVDWYYGPAALAARVEAEPPVEPARLVEEGAELRARIEAEGGGAWLAEQARGLHTYARVLAGEGLSFLDEVEGSYGVRPALVDEETFAAAHARLDAIVGGSGDLAPRYVAWRAAHTVPGQALAELIDAVLLVLQERARAIVPLPEGEAMHVTYVTDEPWNAFNFYEGALQSRIAVNTDVPMPWTRVLEIVAHEAYPGHHAERVMKELLVRGEGLLGEAIGPVSTPQAVVSEGIARLAQRHGLAEEVVSVAVPIVERHGVAVDVEESLAVVEAVAVLEHVSTNTALLVHEHGLGREEAMEYLGRWSLRGESYATQQYRFLTDPTWRAYAPTYTEGTRLCGAFLERHPEDGMRRLLTEQIAVSALAALA
jgi:hypothetical protein